jgi:hypothetical protein
MTANFVSVPNEQRQLQRAIEEAMGQIRRTLQKPIYLQVKAEKNGALTVKHIEFLTIEEFASLCRVEERTVYTWLERAEKTGLRCYRPPGSRGILFEMNEAIEWILNNPNLENA